MISGRRHPNPAIIVSIIFLVAQVWLCVRPMLYEREPGAQYLGFPHLPTDHYAYMMYAGQTERDGAILTKNMFTTSPQEGRFLMIGLAAAGAFEALVPLADPVVWHALRIIVLALFCLVLWKLCSELFDDRWKAAAAHAFVLFSGGLDWIVRPLAREWFAETGAPWANFLDNPWNFNVFYASTNLVWAIPMTIVATAFLYEIRLSRAFAGNDQDAPDAALTAGFRMYLRGLVRGLVFAVLWFIHPYTAIVWGGVVLTSTFLPPPGVGLSRSLLTNLPAAVGPALVAAFIVWSQQDPVVAASNAQTGLWKLNYPAYIYPIVYGPWLLLPLVLFLKRGSVDRQSLRWLVIWFTAGLAMTLNPFVTGAKFQFSFFIPLALLEMAGLFALTDWLAKARPAASWKIPVVLAVIALASINTAAGLVSDINPPATRTAATATADHLRQLDILGTLPDGGVLCDPYEGMLVPWKSGKPVFVGQWFLSTRFMEKADLVRWFYSGAATPEQLAGFLNITGIRWVLYGPREKAAGTIPPLDGLTLKSEVSGRQIWEWKGRAAQ